VLLGLNLSIPANKTTALVGASGSGKSTIVGLIERWYVPASGSILLDGRDVSELNIQWLRTNVRLVQQVRQTCRRRRECVADEIGTDIVQWYCL
jgi:ATP-binding cassette subfamily B (MDR/TAP) protein 1